MIVSIVFTFRYAYACLTSFTSLQTCSLTTGITPCLNFVSENVLWHCHIMCSTLWKNGGDFLQENNKPTLLSMEDLWNIWPCMLCITICILLIHKWSYFGGCPSHQEGHTCLKSFPLSEYCILPIRLFSSLNLTFNHYE